MEENGKRGNQLGRVLLALWTLLAILGIVFFIKYGLSPSIKEITIQDTCGRVFNQIQHSINDASECQARCVNQCRSIDYEFKESNFREVEDSCNTCKCICVG